MNKSFMATVDEVLEKRKKHWVDTKINSNCFFVDADNLRIKHGSWDRQTIKERKEVDVAELHGVCWLDVGGKFETAKLSPNTIYEVVFLIKLKEKSKWEVEVNVSLILPGGDKKEKKEDFQKKEREKLIEIPVGEYFASPERRTSEEIEFSIYEKSDTNWKEGLVIIGVSIRPKGQDQCDTKSNREYFLDAKSLSIAWAESNLYWHWTKDGRDIDVPVLKQKEVSELYVSGTFDTTKLSAVGTTTYEVAFEIKFKKEASEIKSKKEKNKQVSGMEAAVNVELILPDGNKQKRKEKLMECKQRQESMEYKQRQELMEDKQREELMEDEQRKKWIEIPVGEFVASPLRTGKIEVKIYEDSGDWKGGLIDIKGIAIRPVVPNKPSLLSSTFTV